MPIKTSYSAKKKKKNANKDRETMRERESHL